MQLNKQKINIISGRKTEPLNQLQFNTVSCETLISKSSGATLPLIQLLQFLSRLCCKQGWGAGAGARSPGAKHFSRSRSRSRNLDLLWSRSRSHK